MSILDAVLRVIDARTAGLDTHALYEGTVVKQTSDGLLEVKLDDTRFGATGMQHLEIAFGIPGVEVEVAKGTRVAVGFHDGRRDKPTVRHWLSGTPTVTHINASSGLYLGESALETALGPAPRLGVARVTDLVVVGGFQGAITTSSLTVKAGL